MEPVVFCGECGLADGGHMPSCSRWQTMTSYEILKGQKDAILDEQSWKLTQKIMTELDSRKGLIDHLDEDAWEEVFVAIQEIILGRKVTAKVLRP